MEWMCWIQRRVYWVEGQEYDGHQCVVIEEKGLYFRGFGVDYESAGVDFVLQFCFRSPIGVVEFCSKWN